MPLGGFIVGFLFEDFTFINDNGQLVPSQNGPFSLPGNAQATLAAAAQVIEITVTDDDEEFDDGFQDDPGGQPLNQILANDITTTNADGDPVSLSSGAVLEVEFTLTATPAGGGAPIDLLFVAAGPGENQGDLFLVVSTAPLIPGTTYDIAFKNDGGGTPYGEIVCFAAGTQIATPDGPVAVERLVPGDRVLTLDHGPQPILWQSARHLAAPRPDHRPVLVRAGAFGPGRPARDLAVSPHHALLWDDPANDLLFDSRQVLSAAKNFRDGHRIEQSRRTEPVSYHHFLLPRHEIVFANGLPCESFFPGPVARRGLSRAALAALARIHPGVAEPDAPSPLPSARPQVRARELAVALAYARRDRMRGHRAAVT